MNMQALMAQAQKMQRDITKKKEEIDNMEFDGNSELVDVKMSGKKEILSVNIKCEGSLDSDDVEALEDMIKIAVNDVINKINKETEKQLGSYNAGGLGGLF
ncbi:MAG: YbaB/EbfC family nucleoid-associated protein [Bacilli bacterium]|nr:YbaB/EbfC family nucleoid-associated protein [Bacilli bacterium]